MTAQQISYLQAAELFAERHLGGCAVVLLAGSVVRGEGTATSDLDIVAVQGAGGDAPYRASFVEGGWPIEVFVHTHESLLYYFEQDVKRRQPSLLQMCVEGITLRDSEDLARQIKGEAQELLDKGPATLTPEELLSMRYNLTDLLDNFAGAENFEEACLVANSVVVAATDLTLAYNRRWGGHGKWLLRSLEAYSPALREQLAPGLTAFYRQGDKGALVEYAEQSLDRAGGRLFEGYYSKGKGAGE